MQIWQYLITTEVAAPVRGPPNIPVGYLGPAARFYELGLQVVSHPDPLIKADAAELRIQFAYQPQRPLKMMAQLIFASNNSTEDYSKMVVGRFVIMCVWSLSYTRETYFIGSSTNADGPGVLRRTNPAIRFLQASDLRAFWRRPRWFPSRSLQLLNRGSQSYSPSSWSADAISAAVRPLA